MDSDRVSGPPANSTLDNLLLLMLVVLACSAILEPFANGVERGWWVVRSSFESSAPVKQAPVPAGVSEQPSAAADQANKQKTSRPGRPKRSPQSQPEL